MLKTRDGTLVAVLDVDEWQVSGLLSRILVQTDGVAFKESLTGEVLLDIPEATLRQIVSWLKEESKVNTKRKRVSTERAEFQFPIAPKDVIDLLFGAAYLQIDALRTLARRMLVANIEHVQGSLDEALPPDVLDEICREASMTELARIQDAKVMDDERLQREFERRKATLPPSSFPLFADDSAREIWESDEYFTRRRCWNAEFVTKLALENETFLLRKEFPNVSYVRLRAFEGDLKALQHVTRMTLDVASSRPVLLVLPHLTFLELNNCWLEKESNLPQLRRFLLDAPRGGHLNLPNTLLQEFQCRGAQLTTPQLPISILECVQVLNLSYNRFGISQMFPSSESLSKVRWSPHLTHLNLAANSLYSDSYFALFCEALQRECALKVLDLSQNFLQAQSLAPLLSSTTLQELNMRHNRIGFDFEASFLEHAARGMHWDFAENFISAREAEAVIVRCLEMDGAWELILSEQRNATQPYVALRKRFRHLKPKVILDPIGIESEYDL